MADHHDDHPPAAPHVPGSMDIEGQEKTFAGFTFVLTISAVVIIGLLILLALINA